MNKFVKTLLVASMALAATAAEARTYYLSESNTLADGVNYVQVDVNESAGSLNFAVQSIFGGWGLDKFFFNLTPSSFPATISNLSSGWGTVTNGAPYNVSEFGLFTNQQNTDRGASLLNLSFTVSAPSALSLNNLVANSEGWIFAAHQKCGRGNTCQGIGEVTSHHVAGPSTVPLPAAAWLFGSALIGFMGWSSRRRV